jgi:acyl carrier protein
MDRKDIETIYPLSPQQQGMLLESLYAPEAGIRGAHIEQFACLLQGNLDVKTFERAWRQIASHHTILRTAFVWKEHDEPLQVVLRRVEVPFEYQDWRGLASQEHRTRLQTFLTAERQRGFELSKAPLIRVAVFQVGDNAYQLAWTFHHIILDGWSHALLLNEIFSIYLALSTGQNLPQKPSHSYRDFIAWLGEQDLQEVGRYWRKTLQGFTQPTPLGVVSTPDDVGDREQPFGYQFARLPAATTKTLQTWAQQQHLTLNTLVQGVWALLLSRYSGYDDVVFGTTVSGRPSDLEGVESILGLFISTLPLRVQVAPDMRLLPWLQDIQTRQLDLQHYGSCSVGQVRRWSEVPGTLPLYQSLLVFENYPIDYSTFESANLTFEIGGGQVIGAQTNHALTFLITVGTEVGFQLVYHRHRLDRNGATNILAHLTDTLENIALNPEQTLSALLQRIPADQIPHVAPLQQSDSRVSSKTLVAPRTPTEETLARIWADVLGIEQVGVTRSFFELGGYSLLAMEVVSRMRETFEIELPLRVLFDAPTIADLAVVIAQKQAEKIDLETLEQLLTELEQTSLQEAQTLQRPATERG